MLASCWDWASLKYAYYIIEGRPLDAGGWSPTAGIISKSNSSPDEVISFDDCLPSLPENSFFAGVGDFCIGELFEKRDLNSRPQLDLQKMKSSNNPNLVKAVDLLEDNVNSVVGRQSLRANEGGTVGSQTSPDLNYRVKSSRSVWSMLIPVVGSIGTGYAAYRFFNTLTDSKLTLKNLFFVWGGGLAIGLTIGQEYMREKIIKEE
jgi:hypothetical protein